MVYNKNSAQLLFSTEIQNSVMNLLKEFLDTNPATGYLVFQVFEENPIEGLIPISNAKITVSKLLGDEYYISKVITTNSDGKTDPIPMPTVDAKFSSVPGNCVKCSEFIARVEAQNYLTTDMYHINIFDGITSIKSVKLLPSEENGGKIHGNN